MGRTAATTRDHATGLAVTGIAAPSAQQPRFVGRACACVAAGPGRYALVTPAGRVIGALRWHARQQTWVFLPEAGTSWTSGTLADVGLWLRRLQHEQPAAPRSP